MSGLVGRRMRVLVGVLLVSIIGFAPGSQAGAGVDAPALTGQASTAAAPLTGVTVTSVQPGTRTLLANGSPLIVKGYNYFPNAIGEYSIVDAYLDPAQCERDARLMAGAGVTVVRMWANFTRQGDVPTQRRCANGFAAHGIGISWIIGQPVGKPTDPGFQEQFQLYLDRMIAGLGDHPATYHWIIGNEIELLPDCGFACQTLWFGQENGPTGMLNDLALAMKAKDPNHLVGTSVSAAGCFGTILNSNVPALDVWGLNVYPGVPDIGATCGGSLFFTRLDQDPRPKYLTEFGTDRFHCHGGLRDQGTGYVATCAPGSHEDQQGQANWLTGIWDSMVRHLATPANPNGTLSGGTQFFFADGWDNCTFFCAATSTNHDVTAIDRQAAPDGSISVEWWGVAHAQIRGATVPRITTLAFDALASRWSTTPPPAITSGPVIDGPACAPVVRWETSEPATTEVQAALDGDVIKDGELIADNSIYGQLEHNQALTTTHVAGLVGMTHGVPIRVVVRSFTADGRSVTAEPLKLTVAPLC